MKKYFRKIVINNKEYDWLYNYYNYCDYSWIKIFDIYYVYKKDVKFRKRKFFKEYKVDINVKITPVQIEELIRYGKLLSASGIRRKKLKIINKISNECR